jgi:hypothetical protein
VTGTVVDFTAFRNARIEKHSIGLPAKWQRLREERAKARAAELIQFAKSGGPDLLEALRLAIIEGRDQMPLQPE